MTRRWASVANARPHYTIGDWVTVITAGLFAVVAFLALVALFLATIPRQAHAHDSWISRGALKNQAGEWCCGVGDCGVVAPDAVHPNRRGYSVIGPVTYGAGATGNEADGPTRTEQLRELIPYSQAQPSPDGAYWRCKRPDGTPRCFFAPPPGS